MFLHTVMTSAAREPGGVASALGWIVLGVYALLIASLIAFCLVSAFKAKARALPPRARRVDPAQERNIRMPYYVVARLEDELCRRGRRLNGARILMLGLPRRKDSSDLWDSPAFNLLELLEQRGATVAYNDPNIPSVPQLSHCRHLNVTSIPVTENTLSSRDAVIISADRAEYDHEWIAKNSSLVIDL